jgi:hypothetical protein
MLKSPGSFLLLSLTLSAGLLLIPVSRRAAAAPRPIYDVTGHWSGTAQSAQGGSAQNVEGQFTASSNHKTFTGTFTVHAQPDNNFTVRGKVSPTGKVTATLIPPPGAQGHSASISGQLTVATDTLQGTFVSKGHGHDHGTFTISKQ